MRADPAFALAISGYMLWSARTVARVGFVQLLDRELPGQDRQRIKDVILACAGARDVHDLRTRFSGDRTFIEYHLEVDGRLTVDRGHETADANAGRCWSSTPNPDGEPGRMVKPRSS